MMASRFLGAAMLLDLALERGRFRPRLLDHPGEGACQHTGLAAGVDGNVGVTAAADRLHGRGQATDRPRQRT